MQDQVKSMTDAVIETIIKEHSNIEQLLIMEMTTVICQINNIYILKGLSPCAAAQVIIGIANAVSHLLEDK